jgi:hypothetical protein
MTKKRRHSESPGKTEVSANRSAGSGPISSTDPTQSPMARFRDLTRRLLNVSRGQIKDEQQRFDAANAARRKNKQ